VDGGEAEVSATVTDDCRPVQPEHLCWTRERLELRRWLLRNALSLGELYEGAVVLLYQDPVPGRVRLVAHAVREIRNRLPDAVTPARGGGRFEYSEAVEAIRPRWEEEAISIHPIDDGPPSDPDQAARPLAISRALADDLVALFEAHRAASERAESAPYRLFEGLAPENQGRRQALLPTVREWKRVTDWFMGHAHDGGKPDSAVPDATMRANFEVFEEVLYALALGVFPGMDVLDEILAEANS
jgi:hypothetical protein